MAGLERCTSIAIAIPIAIAIKHRYPLSSIVLSARRGPEMLEMTYLASRILEAMAESGLAAAAVPAEI